MKEKILKIDLGCGKTKKKGFIGYDLENYKNFYKKDFIQHNLTKGIPLKSNTVHEINTSHFLEHLPDHYNKKLQIIEDGVEWFIKEMWRVSKNNTIIKIELPLYNLWEQHKTHFRYDALKNYIQKGMFEEIKRDLEWNHTLHPLRLFNVKIVLRTIK